MWKIITDCCCGRTYLHSVHRLYLLKWLKVPTSLYLIFTLFSSRAFKSQFTFIPYSHCGSLSLALLFSPLSPPLSLPRLYSSSFSPSLPSSICVTSPLIRGLQREGWWLPFLTSLLWFPCSCWSAIKGGERRSFHTNYNTIMKCSVKGTVKNEGQTVVNINWIESIRKHL